MLQFHMMKNKIMVLVVAIFLIAGVGVGVYRETQLNKTGVTSSAVTPIKESAKTLTFEEEKALKSAIERTLEKKLNRSFSSEDVALGEYLATENWAFGGISVNGTQPDLEERKALAEKNNWPEVYNFQTFSFLAYKENKEWQIAFEPSNEFYKWVSLAPEAVISSEAKRLILDK